MDEVNRCEIGEKLVKQSSTWVGKFRLEQHLKFCKVCQEKRKIEDEMTELIVLAGGWEEQPEYPEKIRRLVQDLPVPKDHFIDWFLRKVDLKLVVMIILLITIGFVVYYLRF